MLPAKCRNHLSSKNIEKLFLLGALKVAVKNFYEYEQEIKLAGGKMVNCNCIRKDVLLCFNNICFVFVLFYLILIRFWRVKLLGNLGA